MGGVATGGSTWKNILIGILTTVVAYSIVNYIKDKKEKKKEKEKLKTETIQAWNTLIRYEEQSTANYLAGLCIEDPATQLEALIYEKDQLAKNYGIIAAKQGIDDDLASFATRAVGNANELKKILENYLTEFKKINPKDPQSGRLYQELDTVFMDKINMARERDMESLKTMFTSLQGKFGNEFSVPDDNSQVTEATVTGKWKESGVNKLFDIRGDASFTMTINNESYPGKWQLIGKTLQLVFDDESGSISLHITRYHPKFFRFTINEETTERQCCKK